MEETKHWENLKSGDIKALKELYNLHISGLYKYGIVLCHDEDKVKDAIHDMFLSFWNNRSGLSVPASGKAYLMVSMRRRIFDKGPKSNLETIPLEDGHLDDRITTDHEVQWMLLEEEEEQRHKMEHAMARISDRQKPGHQGSCSLAEGMDNDYHLFNVMDMSTKARSQALYGKGSLFNMREGIKSMKTGLLSTITNCRLKDK